MLALKTAITDIVTKITVGMQFDSHLVIYILMHQYLDEYLNGFKASGKLGAALYHGAISRMIGENTSLVNDTKTSVFTTNCKGNSNDNHLWQRI